MSTFVEINAGRKTGNIAFLSTGLVCLSIGLGVLALAFAGNGFRVAYTYSSFDDSTKIVGGDAYNYIIIGLRGCVWLLAAVFCGVFSALFGLMAFLRESLNRLAFFGSIRQAEEIKKEEYEKNEDPYIHII